MLPSRRQELLTSLVATIADYRSHEIQPITVSHVERWLNQFSSAYQPHILTALDRIFRRLYYSRAMIKDCYRVFLSENLIGESPALEVLARTRFIENQETGGSQRELLELMDEVLRESFGIRLVDCGLRSATIYVYLDDGIYTGNRIRYDLTWGNNSPAWIPASAPHGCQLLVYTLAQHKAGWGYASTYIDAAAADKGISVTYYYELELDNVRGPSSKVECLWPQESTADPNAKQYLQEFRSVCQQYGLDFSRMFRPAGTPMPETMFASAEERAAVEAAFLEGGVAIMRSHASIAPSIRPLGFEKLQSLGFGTLFLTFRNIANNCPLVLWWGLGGWYALFERRTNVQTSTMTRSAVFADDDIPF